jgi:hypothetical protein
MGGAFDLELISRGLVLKYLALGVLLELIGLVLVCLAVGGLAYVIYYFRGSFL